MFTRSLALASALLLLAACEEPDSAAALAGPEGDLAVTIESTAAADSGGTRVAFTLRNRGGGDVSLPRCDATVAHVLERLEGERWVRAAAVATVCIAIYPMVPLALSPNETHADTHLIAGRGTYRIGVVYTRPPSAAVYEAHSRPLVIP